MKQKLLKVLYNFLALCARIYISRHKIQVVGITGSVGKTSCRMVVSEVLNQVQTMSPDSKSSRLRFYTSPKNFNSELGLVFSVFQIEEYSPSIKNLLKISGNIFKQSIFGKKKYDVLIAEYGIDAPKDMEHLLKIAIPDIAVLTKLDKVHSANFPGGVEEYWQEKWLLLLAAKIKTYINLQDSYSQEKLELVSNTTEIFGDISRYKPVLKKNETYIAGWNFIFEEKNISINLLGKENIYYTLLALHLAQDLGISLNQESYDFVLELQPGRCSLFQKGNNIFIDSSYNAAPESMKLLIENTKNLKKNLFPDSHIIYMLGDMRELGIEEGDAHTHIGKDIMDAELICNVGPLMYKYLVPELQKSGFTGENHSFLSSREAGKYLKKYLRDHTKNHYIILFKGSQNTIFMEESLAQILTPTEQKNLPRQSEDWKKKKEVFFMSL